ncbi:MAG: hypothetical protein K6G71_02945 [Clostridiales bacterium]|nr:hypothetical protein [Clostridiales bacterium]
MKKAIVIVLCLMIAVSLCSCGTNGDKVPADAATTSAAASAKYSQEDIDSAIDTIKKEFDRNWPGCTLKEIYYAGDETTAQYRDWADRNNAEEVIVLLSTFETGTPAGNSGLNSNQVYEGWNWILVRNAGGQWQHVDHGY